MTTNRTHYLIAAGLMVTVGPATTSGAASAPAGAEGSSAPPPVERVARELRTGAKSVIVFVSAGDKEYVATGGARRPTGARRFRVGSVTKTFTATIVLKLVEEGALRLSSTLEEHVPGVIPRSDEITIRQLLQHRSGLADFGEYPSWLAHADRSRSTRPIDTLRFAGSKPLVFAPGRHGRYSNTNYIALGLVIEKVTGHSYAQELEQRILDPLGLDHTELPQTRRLPYLDDGGSNPNVGWAAGAIVSNAHDLSRFYSALLSGRLLSSATLATMKKTVEPTVPVPRSISRGQSYLPSRTGLGIHSTPLPCGRSWGHGGGILDYQTLVSASEDGDRVAVVSFRGPRSLPPLPPVERALLCAEPRSAAGSAKASRRIAFSSGGAPLYVMNADGSGQRWLTLTLASWGTSAWSPDGRRIAFGSNRGGNSHVYVVNADGSAQQSLTPERSHDFAPAWSPDGRKIAFGSTRGGNSDIYVMNTDGSRRRNLSRNPANEYAFAWSPDGRKIAFLSYRGGNSRVYVMTADGSGQRRLTRGNALPSAPPAWSPDGRRIAFVSERDGNAEIYVVNADGTGQRNLTRSPRYEGDPAWSPDGRKIAFASGSRSCRAGPRACVGYTDIYVMNADGSGKRRLTRVPRDDFAPAWSPDGRRIAFMSKRDGNREIYVMNTDGSGQRNLTRSPAHEFWFAWSPVRTK
jgi:Tol biopolymer transport system component